MPIDHKKWFKAMKEIESARKAGRITKAQAKKLVLECEQAYKTPSREE